MAGVVDSGGSLPGGRVTFVVTDVEGSTRLERRVGSRYPALLERHRVLLREAWTSWRGVEVRTHGDSSLVAFSDAAAALAACGDAQRRLQSEPWPDDGTLRVRMGVHAGLAVPRAGTYVALAVPQAARVSAAAHGGQVLITQEVADGAVLPEATSLVPLGRFRLHDFESPVLLNQLAGPGLPNQFPAVRALRAEGHNLPQPLTSLVGRRTELRTLEELTDRCPLTTVVGAGGVGKTRLAVEAGRRAAPRWDGGVWFVDLAPLEEAGLVPGAVAAAVGVRPAGDEDPWDSVLHALGSARALLVLDNCEHHAVTVRGLLRSLLSACEGVHVLVTSREPLHHPTERVLRLAPLPLPAAAGPAAGETTAAPAVQLFLARALDVEPNFAMDDDTLSDVAGICRGLDGLPLAIEIAAARMAVMSPADVLAGLSRRFQVLRSRDLSAPLRQRTLDGLLDWSMRALRPGERAAFRRLSLFGGTFGMDAATAAIAGGDLTTYDVPELVWSLVEKSIVVEAPEAGGTRYRLLETVRAYGRDLLATDHDLQGTAERMASWYAGWLGPRNIGKRRWVSRLTGELDNVRAAISAVAGSDPELAQQLACTLGRYHEAVQSLRAGVTEVAHLSHQLPDATSARVALLATLSDLHLRLGDVPGAERAAGEARTLRAIVGTPDWDDVGLEKSSGEIALRKGRPQDAAAIAESALRRGLSLRGAARMWNLLGLARAFAGDLDAAAGPFHHELETCERLGDEVLLAHAHGNVAELALRRGDWASAARHQRECLELAAALGQPGMLAYSLNVAARLAVADADGGSGAALRSDVDRWAVAVRLAAKAEALLEESGLSLYEDDRRLTDSLLTTARAALEPDGRAVEDAGRHADLADALALGRQVLDLTGSLRPSYKEAGT